MRVARRGLHLRVPKELADHGQALAGCHGRRSKSMSKVVDPNIFDPGAGADALPEGLEVTERLAGQGADDDPRIAIDALGAFQIDAARMALANPKAIFMHCMPMYRGSEVTAEVADGPQSVVYDEAENRLHAQKAIIKWCLT